MRLSVGVVQVERWLGDHHVSCVQQPITRAEAVAKLHELTVVWPSLTMLCAHHIGHGLLAVHRAKL